MIGMGSTIKIEQNKRIPHYLGKEQGIPSEPKDGGSNNGFCVSEFLKSHNFEVYRSYIKWQLALMGNEYHEASSETRAVLPDADDAHETESRGISSDSSDNELSSCDKEPSASEAVVPSRPEEGNGEAPLKKRRKETATFPPEIRRNAKLRKYWLRRYLLFSKFDQGIRLDEESWYSVTPERVAKQAAKRCRCDVIVDAFCGAGGNAIQFALTCNRVIAIDIDPKKIEIAYHNAQIYGVAHKIQFIEGDFLQLADSLKADVVFLSPPWGGPGYLSAPVYDLEKNLQPVPFSQLLAASRKISPNIGAFLPRNCNTFSLIKEAGIGGRVDIEKNFLNKRLIAVTAYYHNLIKDK